MRLLLDTHIALWAVSDDEQLSLRGRELINSARNTVHVSVTSLWEIAIEHALRREQMPVSAAQALEYFDRSGYLITDVRPEHAVRVEQLPHVHADPFDRMLVAQAVEEGFHLLTHDGALTHYSDLVITV
jgi:PIN domain nuclease of toxin-antitoxin system